MDSQDSGCLDWGKLGRDVSVFFAAVPRVEFMYGRLDVQAKAKAPRKKRVRDEEEHEETEPEKIVGNKTTGKEKDHQTGRVTKLQKALKARVDNKDVLSFVVNPESFSETVENIFDLSVGVKEGFVKLKVTPDGIPVVS
jgi:hypothetical protein